MGGRVKADSGQWCECEWHPLGQPPLDLVRMFWQRARDDVLCFAWWCGWCEEEFGGGEWEDEWPARGGDGRFKAPTHCQIVPGLD